MGNNQSDYMTPTFSGPQSEEEPQWLLSVVLLLHFGVKDARRTNAPHCCHPVMNFLSCLGAITPQKT